MYDSKPGFDYSLVHEEDMSIYGSKDHQCVISKLFFAYSVRKLFTGFIRAALML